MDQARPSQEHRLKRRALWASLWLAKLIYFMPDVQRLPPRVQDYLERWADALAAFIIDLVIFRARHFPRRGAIPPIFASAQLRRGAARSRAP